MADTKNPSQSQSQDQNEGEGSRSAARHYGEAVERTVRQGHVEEDAERAARDVAKDPEGFRRAEEEGKKRSAGDAPGDVER